MTPQHSGPSKTQAVVAAFSVGNRHYERRLNDCGKKNCQRCGGSGHRHPSHGPYWYLCIVAQGKWRRIYVGKDLDTSLFINAQGNVDWDAVKRGRPRKNYTESTNTEAPGQGDLIGDFPDGAAATQNNSRPTIIPDKTEAPRQPNRRGPHPDRRDPASDALEHCNPERRLTHRGRRCADPLSPRVSPSDHAKLNPEPPVRVDHQHSLEHHPPIAPADRPPDPTLEEQQPTPTPEDRRHASPDRRILTPGPQSPGQLEQRTGARDPRHNRRKPGVGRRYADPPSPRDRRLRDAATHPQDLPEGAGHIAPNGEWVPDPTDPSAEASAKAKP